MACEIVRKIPSLLKMKSFYRLVFSGANPLISEGVVTNIKKNDAGKVREEKINWLLFRKITLYDIKKYICCYSK